MNITNSKNINNENENNNQNNGQNEDNIYYIKANEIRYKDYLLEKEQILYDRCINKGYGSSNNKMTITLLVYCIIIILFTIVGFFFRISNNKGYKQYKNEIEKELYLVDTNLPDNSEMEKILKFYELFNLHFYNTSSYNINCSYDIFRTGFCTTYEWYCNNNKYANNTCNYVDYMYYKTGIFKCNYEDYSQNYCSNQQYIDYKNKYLDEFIYYGGKPKRIDMRVHFEKGDNESVYFTFDNLYGISFEKFWCDIGKYDTTVFISLFFLIIIFIILFIIDLCIKKNNIANGIIYYIIVIIYMILYIVLRIFICLLFCFLIYSIVVASSTPKLKKNISSLITYSDSYDVKRYNISYNNNYNHNTDNTDNTFKSSQNLWNDQRVKAIISAVSVLFLFLFVCLLDKLKIIIINYLGFNFEEKLNNEFKRKMSIRIGDEMQEIEVIFKHDIYLDDNIARKKIKFRKIKFAKLGNDIYYLKLSNKGLIDQLGFSEWNFPNINEGFNRLRVIFNLIYVVIFFSIILTKFQIHQEYIYIFLIYYIDLGFAFKYDKNIKKYGELAKSIIYYRLYIYIIISIVLLICMLKRAFFGGFKYKIIFGVFFILSILFIIFNFINLILSIILEINSWICFSVFLIRIIFNDYIIIGKLIIQGSLNTIIIIIQVIIFGKSIAYTIFMYSIKSENDKLGSKNQDTNNNSISTGRKEEGFEFTGLDFNPHYFQAINNTTLPKDLFYIKTENRRRQVFIPEDEKLKTVSRGGDKKMNTINNNDDNPNNLGDNGNNITSNENSNNPIINPGDDINEIIKLTNENERLKKENEKIKQEIENIKNQIAMITKNK